MKEVPQLADLATIIGQQLTQQYPQIKAALIYRHAEHDGLVLFLSVQPHPIPEHLLNRLGSIARSVDMMVPIHSIQLNELRPIPVSSIRQIQPEPWVEHTNKLAVENLVAKLNGAMRLALNIRTCIEVSKAGIYIACEVRHGGQTPGLPPLSEDEMLGQPISAIAGQAAHDKIVAAVNKAVDTGAEVEVFYQAQFRGETCWRFFQATCVPKPDRTGAWLWVSRIPFEQDATGGSQT